ncbi:MAG: TldD/PmbA family protein [Pseudomonadota bacterium]
MSQDLSSLAHAALDAAKAAGAQSADVLAYQGRSVSIEVREGVLEHAERAEAIDLGLRVLLGQKQAIVSVSDTRPETLTMMAERAVAMAREAPDDPYIGLATPDELCQTPDATGLDLVDPAPEPAAEWLQSAALESEAAARAVSGVSQVQSASSHVSQTEFHLAATNGFSAGYARTVHSRSCVAIAGEGTGMERDYDYDSRTYAADLRPADEIGREAGDRAVAALNARQPATGTYPVLFDERVSSSLIGHLLSAANGASVARGSSWLMEALGEQVLPENLSIIEDPCRARISASRPFDAEGLPTSSRAIVQDGVLTGWTLDLASARQLGMSSTGSATRGVSSPPSPSTTSIALTQGQRSRDDLISQMGTGLLVTSMIGSTINPNTGDYSRGASGFWVENGEITYPVNECTIAGNLRDILRRIEPANDARSHLSRVVPSLLIDGMTLAGN